MWYIYIYNMKLYIYLLHKYNKWERIKVRDFLSDYVSFCVLLIIRAFICFQADKIRPQLNIYKSSYCLMKFHQEILLFHKPGLCVTNALIKGENVSGSKRYFLLVYLRVSSIRTQTWINLCNSQKHTVKLLMLLSELTHTQKYNTLPGTHCLTLRVH